MLLGSEKGKGIYLGGGGRCTVVSCGQYGFFKTITIIKNYLHATL